MKKGFFRIFILTFLFSASSAFSAELKGIDFSQAGEKSELELLVDSNDVIANKFHIKEDKQIIIDLTDVKASEKVLRAFDTSEFSGSVVFVSAYQKSDNPNDLRVAIQLRDNVRSIIKRKENRIVLQVENRFGVFTESELNENDAFKKNTINQKNIIAKLNVPKSDTIEDILENLTMSGPKKYIGKKISINVKDVPVEEIFKMISEVTGFSVIITDSAKGVPPMTLSITNVPWDQALDTILGLNKLVAEKNGSILIVQSLAAITAKKKLEAEEKKALIETEPVISRVFPISNAKAEQLTQILTPYLTPERGSAVQDPRTNSIIVRDTLEQVEKIKKIIDALDKQNPQVLIESKIVEVNESYTKQIGLQQGIGFGYDPVTPIDEVTNEGPGFSFSSAPATGLNARNLFSFTVGRFSRLINLNFQLQLMESESKGKIIASPKVITQSNQTATLRSVDQTSFRVINGVGDLAQSTFQNLDAPLELTVTPIVTNEGSISMNVEITKGAFGARPSDEAPPNTTTRQIKTNVLVDNGSTIVIGGLYNYSKSDVHSGIPFLKDVPLIGWLFRTPYAPEITKSEMMIFITPRIINQEEAGLVDSV